MRITGTRIKPRRRPGDRPHHAGDADVVALLWAFARNFRLDEIAVTEFLRENVRRTFDEDKVTLEAQQRIIGPETEPTFQVTIRADAGPTQGRRLLASMIEVESRGSA